jgi:hypothetical protein
MLMAALRAEERDIMLGEFIRVMLQNGTPVLEIATIFVFAEPFGFWEMSIAEGVRTGEAACEKGSL